MRYIAVAYKKNQIGNNYFLLEPCGFVVGTYNEELDTFIDADGRLYCSLSEINLEDDIFFDKPISLKKLREKSSPKKPDAEIAKDYFVKNAKRFMAEVDYNNEVIQVFALKDLYTTSIEKVIDLDDFQKYLSSKVIDQEDAIRELTNILNYNYNIDDDEKIKHVILNGPKGTGKTTMLKLACEYLQIPFFSTSYIKRSNEGISIKTVEELITELVNAYQGNVVKAETAILVVTGVEDALMYEKNNKQFAHYVFSSLKEIIKGTKLLRSEDDTFDTSGIMVVIEGNFEDLVFKYKQRAGFYEEDKTIDENKYFQITKEDLIDAGISEDDLDDFEIVNTVSLNVKSLTRIMTETEASPLRSLQTEFEKNGVDLRYDDAFIESLAMKVHKSKIGAKSIKAVLNEYKKYAQDTAAKHKVKSIKLTRETINDPKNYDVES